MTQVGLRKPPWGPDGLSGDLNPGTLDSSCKVWIKTRNGFIAPLKLELSELPLIQPKWFWQSQTPKLGSAKSPVLISGDFSQVKVFIQNQIATSTGLTSFPSYIGLLPICSGPQYNILSLHMYFNNCVEILLFWTTDSRILC